MLIHFGTALRNLHLLQPLPLYLRLYQHALSGQYLELDTIAADTWNMAAHDSHAQTLSGAGQKRKYDTLDDPYDDRSGDDHKRARPDHDAQELSSGDAETLQGPGVKDARVAVLKHLDYHTSTSSQATPSLVHGTVIQFEFAGKVYSARIITDPTIAPSPTTTAPTPTTIAQTETLPKPSGLLDAIQLEKKFAAGSLSRPQADEEFHGHVLSIKAIHDNSNHRFVDGKWRALDPYNDKRQYVCCDLVEYRDVDIWKGALPTGPNKNLTYGYHGPLFDGWHRGLVIDWACGHLVIVPATTKLAPNAYAGCYAAILDVEHETPEHLPGYITVLESEGYVYNDVTQLDFSKRKMLGRGDIVRRIEDIQFTRKSIHKLQSLVETTNSKYDFDISLPTHKRRPSLPREYLRKGGLSSTNTPRKATAFPSQTSTSGSVRGNGAQRPHGHTDTYAAAEMGQMTALPSVSAHNLPPRPTWASMNTHGEGVSVGTAATEQAYFQSKAM